MTSAPRRWRRAGHRGAPRRPAAGGWRRGRPAGRQWCPGGAVAEAVALGTAVSTTGVVGGLLARRVPRRVSEAGGGLPRRRRWRQRGRLFGIVRSPIASSAAMAATHASAAAVTGKTGSSWLGGGTAAVGAAVAGASEGRHGVVAPSRGFANRRIPQWRGVVGGPSPRRRARTWTRLPWRRGPTHALRRRPRWPPPAVRWRRGGAAARAERLADARAVLESTRRAAASREAAALAVVDGIATRKAEAPAVAADVDNGAVAWAVLDDDGCGVGCVERSWLERKKVPGVFAVVLSVF